MHVVLACALIDVLSHLVVSIARSFSGTVCPRVAKSPNGQQSTRKRQARNLSVERSWSSTALTKVDIKIEIREQMNFGSDVAVQDKRWCIESVWQSFCLPSRLISWSLQGSRMRMCWVQDSKRTFENVGFYNFCLMPKAPRSIAIVLA